MMVKSKGSVPKIPEPFRWGRNYTIICSDWWIFVSVQGVRKPVGFPWIKGFSIHLNHLVDSNICLENDDKKMIFQMIKPTPPPKDEHRTWWVWKMLTSSYSQVPCWSLPGCTSSRFLQGSSPWSGPSAWDLRPRRLKHGVFGKISTKTQGMLKLYSI